MAKKKTTSTLLLTAVSILLFGMVGGSILLFTHAATPVNNAIDPEDGTVTGNATTPADATTSGGKYISFNAPTTTGPTGRCTHTTTRICYNGKLWMINGVDMPWRQYSYAAGHGDFGGGMTDGVQANKADIASRMSQVHNTGSTVVRWWMFEGGAWQINRDASGMPTSLNNAIYADIDAALALADQYNLYYNFTLFQGVDNGAFPGTWRTNAAQRTALANVLGPLFAHYKDNPRVMSWELFNEPEWQIWNNIDGANATDCVALAKALVASIRTNAPKTMTTIGEAQLTGDPMWKDVDLDFDSPHYYDPFTGSDVNALVNTAAGVQARYGMTRPIVLGEFPLVGTTAAQNVSRLNEWYNRGYAGAWDWSIFYDQTSDQIKPDYAAQTTFNAQHSDIGPK